MLPEILRKIVLPGLIAYSGRTNIEEITTRLFEICQLENIMENLEEIISRLFEICDVENIIEHLKLSEKSEKAENLRTEGNKYYRQRNFEKAVKLYNASIMVAPHPTLSENELDVFRAMENKPKDEYSVPLVNPARYCDTVNENGEALGKAYANRAAVMLELKQFDKCIESIDLALDYGYPENLKSRLEERKQRCIDAKKQAEGTSASLGNEKTKNSNACGESSFLSSLSAKPKALPKLQQSNPNYPAVGAALNVVYKSDRGRGIYATQEIHPGEVLAVDEPFAIYLPKESLSTHCLSCAVMCLTPLPCPGCCQVVFCSKTCRIKGLAKDHWLECKIQETMIHYGFKSCEFKTWSTSYKLLRTFSFKQMKAMHKELKNDLKDPSRILGSNSNGKYLSSSYQAVYYLQENTIDGEKGQNLLALSISMLSIARFLQLSERFFIDEVGNPVAVTREDLIEATKMLAINCNKISNNAFQFTTNIGGAIYPTISLLNHSCFPCAERVSRNGHEIIIAMRPVTPGEEITISYGVFFDLDEKQHRRKALDKSYHFTCNCEACVGNWPTMTHLPLANFRCPKCRLPWRTFGLCINCTVQTREEETHKANLSDFATAVEIFYRYEMMKKSTTKDSVNLCKTIETLYKQLEGCSVFKLHININDNPAPT